MLNNLLFVCVGNICRSPMAAGFFSNQLKELNDITINSAGLHAVVGESAVSKAQKVMLDIGIDISEHRAQQLTYDMVSTANLVLVMEKAHKKEIESIIPASRGKVYLLGQWQDFEIPDPYCEPIEAFDQSLLLIKQAWQDWRLRIVR